MGQPLGRITVDIVGPFPEMARGNKYILIATDCFTKLGEVFPMPNQQATTWWTLWYGDFLKVQCAHLFQEVCRESRRSVPPHTIPIMTARVTAKSSQEDADQDAAISYGEAR